MQRRSSVCGRWWQPVQSSISQCSSWTKADGFTASSWQSLHCAGSPKGWWWQLTQSPAISACKAWSSSTGG
jgi:hypothetical protein